MCKRIRAQALDKAGHLTIAHLSGLNACIICAGSCSMQCNCAKGLHFSAFYLTSGVNMIKENDERTSFYTGLPSWNVFQEIFDFLLHFLIPCLILMCL